MKPLHPGVSISIPPSSSKNFYENCPKMRPCPASVSSEIQLKKANKKIADLLEDIRRLSDELRKKETPLTGFVEVASSQSRRLASIIGATQDTILWDPSVDPGPKLGFARGRKEPSTETLHPD